MFVSFSIPHISSDFLLDLAKDYSEDEGTCFLFSGGEADSAQVSILGLFSEKKIEGSSWESLEKDLEWNHLHSFPKYMGYLSYEMGATSVRDKNTPYTPSLFPSYQFYQASVIVVYRRIDSSAEVYCNSLSKISLVQELISSQDLKVLSRNISSKKIPQLSSWEFSESLDSYSKKVEEIKEYIRDGEVYQVNLSQNIEIDGEVNSFLVFRSLIEKNPAPFSAFIRTDQGAIVSSSPERLLKKQKKSLETRPIKGTFPRGKTPKEDRENREKLLQSDKDRAELLMITDLMRNDLGRVARSGSVKTEKIWHCEEYSNVFHLLSIITAETDEESSVEILRTVFPGGSITGCPKLRAMEVIHELEQRPRNVYTGSIGYFSGDGDFDFNIAIRTLWVEKSKINVQLGGAVVIDSDPKSEYEETLHKGASIFEVLRSL
ncbi:MAG: aminodeoxychorismate synthase, component I [Waddliaceae bacterium]|nr:aminodeoxychorismate synthase, component I [Waddliaceae bacterium]